MTNFEFMSAFLFVPTGLALRLQQQQHKLAMSSIMKMKIAEHPMAIRVMYVEKSALKSLTK